jgi:S1-C subfamily serine protease
MKYVFIFLLILSKTCIAQPNYSLVATSDILSSVRMIVFENEFGTSFIVNRNEQQYLITAKHIFKSVKSGTEIKFKLLTQNKLQEFSFPVSFHSDTNVDIAVIKLPPFFLKNNTVELKNDGESFNVGQDCYFIGYPLGIGTLMENEYLGIYKRAVFSGILKPGLLLFDAHNNVGFSGAPVLTSQGSYKEQFVLGVVSGYQSEKQTVNVVNPNKKKQKEPTSYSYNVNSGIMRVWGIKYANDIIDQIR